MSIDESAAFDCIDHNVLLQKLSQSTNFLPQQVTWIRKLSIVSLTICGNMCAQIYHHLHRQRCPTRLNPWARHCSTYMLMNYPMWSMTLTRVTNPIHEPSENLFNDNCLNLWLPPMLRRRRCVILWQKMAREKNQARIICILDRLTVFLKQE